MPWVTALVAACCLAFVVSYLVGCGIARLAR